MCHGARWEVHGDVGATHHRVLNYVRRPVVELCRSHVLGEGLRCRGREVWLLVLVEVRGCSGNVELLMDFSG